MFNLFITTLALLNQELNETHYIGGAIPLNTKYKRLIAFCAGCSKKAPGMKCTVYASPMKLMWFRHGNQCAFNFKSAAKEKKVVNALKASKRAAQGK
jgi:hypothetical protein